MSLPQARERLALRTVLGLSALHEAHPTLMNWKLLAGGAVLCFLLGYGAGTLGKASSSELDAAHDSTHAAVARATEAEQAREAVEVGARAAIIAQTAQKDSALAVARAATARRPGVIDRVVLREAPADTALARRVATVVADSLQVHEIAPRDKAIVAADSVNRSQSLLLVAERTAREAAQEAVRTQSVEIAALRSARPSWLARQAPKMTFVAGGIAGWFAYRYLAPHL